MLSQLRCPCCCSRTVPAWPLFHGSHVKCPSKVASATWITSNGVRPWPNRPMCKPCAASFLTVIRHPHCAYSTACKPSSSEDPWSSLQLCMSSCRLKKIVASATWITSNGVRPWPNRPMCKPCAASFGTVIRHPHCAYSTARKPPSSEDPWSSLQLCMPSCRLNFAVSTAVHTLASVSWVTRQVSIKSSFSYMDNFERSSSLAKLPDV